jgi:hypothetical protein
MSPCSVLKTHAQYAPQPRRGSSRYDQGAGFTRGSWAVPTGIDGIFLRSRRSRSAHTDHKECYMYHTKYPVVFTPPPPPPPLRE